MAQAAADRRTCVVGALILNRDGHVFVHRRSWQRRLFPGCWDIVGGHVEPGEDLLAALERWLSASVAEAVGIDPASSGSGMPRSRGRRYRCHASCIASSGRWAG